MTLHIATQILVSHFDINIITTNLPAVPKLTQQENEYLSFQLKWKIVQLWKKKTEQKNHSVTV